MFDTKTLPASPGLARRLLALSQINGLEFDDKLVDLAMQDLIGQSTLEAFPSTLGDIEIQALQYVMDWKGRAILLESGNSRARRVALASVFIRPTGKTLILVQPKNYPVWAQMVKEIWPDSKVSVFGNPRYNKPSTGYPDGIEFKEKPDFQADFFITSYGGVIWNDFFSHTTVDYAIVEELDHSGAISYNWHSAVSGMFLEIPSPLFIQDINNLPSDQGRSPITSLRVQRSRATSFISDIIRSYLWAGSGFEAIPSLDVPAIGDYLSRRGYQHLDSLTLFGLHGVSSHLLSDCKGNEVLVFKDSTVENVKNQPRNRDSAIRRILDRESVLEGETGLKLDQIVADALGGDMPSQTLIGSLMTTQWGNIKARHMKEVHDSLSNRVTRSLFLAERTETHRPLKLNFSTQMYDLSQSTDKSQTIEHFILGRFGAPRSLLVSLDDLIHYPLLLSHANYLYLAELPLSEETYSGIKEVCDLNGTSIVCSVISGTFESKIWEQLK